jgi:hypothetical protein
MKNKHCGRKIFRLTPRKDEGHDERQKEVVNVNHFLLFIDRERSPIDP